MASGGLGRTVAEWVASASLGALPHEPSAEIGRIETDWAEPHPGGIVEMGILDGKPRPDILALWNFAVGSSDITSFQLDLTRHVPMLKGWTDLGDQGSRHRRDEYEWQRGEQLCSRLSARARAVAEWLIEVAGLPERLLLVRSQGEEGQLSGPGLPIFDAESAARQRRVEIDRLMRHWADSGDANYERALQLVVSSTLDGAKKSRLTKLLSYLRNPDNDDLVISPRGHH